MDQYTLTVILLAFAFMGWYGAGAVYNRVKSNRVLKMCWRVLRKYGSRGSYKSLGSSGFVIEIPSPTPRVEGLSLSFVLEKRELPINWLIDRARGVRDRVTLRIAVRGVLPNAELFRRGNYFGDILYRRLGGRGLGRYGSVNVYSDVGYEKLRPLITFMNGEEGVWWVSMKGGGAIVNMSPNSIQRIPNLIKILERLATPE